MHPEPHKPENPNTGPNKTRDILDLRASKIRPRFWRCGVYKNARGIEELQLNMTTYLLVS